MCYEKVLEYMEAGELKWRSPPPTESPTLEVEQTRQIFIQVILGLEYYGKVKISDFGVSQFSYALRLQSAGANAIRTSSPSPRRPPVHQDSTEDPSQQSPGGGGGGGVEEDVLMDESDLCKTAGSPAFFAPELCYQGGGSSGGMGSFPSFGGSSLPSPTTFGGAAEEMFMGGGVPSSAPMSSGMMLAVPPSDSVGSGVGTPQRAPSSASASSSSHSHSHGHQQPPPPAQQQPPKERSNRPKFLPSRQHSSNSTKTAPITIPTSPSTPTTGVASPTTAPTGGNNPPPVTAAIDIWALGVTLYCLLFGKPPFNAPTEFMLYKIIPNEDFVVPDRMGKDQKKTGGRWGARDARRRRARKGSVATTAGGGGGVAGMLAMNGRSNSMGTGGVKEDGGAGKDKEDEQEGYEVVEILERLLEKDPTKRITLHDLKRMPWVLRGIPDPELWLIETDPRKEEMVVVQQEDVEGVFRKAKLKDKLKKFKEKTKTTMGLLGRLRSRSTSSVNVLGGGPGSVVSSAASEVSTSTAHTDNTSRSGGGYSTPTAAAAGTPNKSGLGIKKGFRTSTPAQPRTLPGSSSVKGKSREASPVRSPLGRWAPFGGSSTSTNRQGSMETPRSRSPAIVGSFANDASALTPDMPGAPFFGEPDDMGGSSGGDRTVRSPAHSNNSVQTPKPRRQSTNALLSPLSAEDSSSMGHVRRVSSLSVSTDASTARTAPVDAEELSAELRRNKSEMDNSSHHSHSYGRHLAVEDTKSEPGVAEKVTRKTSWIRFVRRKTPTATPLTAITAPTPTPTTTPASNPVGTPTTPRNPMERPGNRRSVTELDKEKADPTVRYRPSNEVFTDDSSVGARSYASLSPGLNRDVPLPPRRLRDRSKQRWHDTDEDEHDDGHLTDDTRVSFSFSDDESELGEYGEGNLDMMIGAGGFVPIRNRGLGWEPLYPNTNPTSWQGSSGASSPAHSPLGSAHHSSAAMSNTSGPSSPRQGTSNLSLDVISSLTAYNSGPFHHQPTAPGQTSPLAYQSFSPRDTDNQRGSLSEDIEERDGEDDHDDDDDDDDDEEDSFLEVRKKSHGAGTNSSGPGSDRARSPESDRRPGPRLSR
ncbi:hypothetical protein FRC04_004189 [Tulasnella sp. 424]|nr:hypothetical protein FRC04_004189 [Tulasnella sp. 424]